MSWTHDLSGRRYVKKGSLQEMFAHLQGIC